jgi:hypothetical protein
LAEFLEALRFARGKLLGYQKRTKSQKQHVMRHKMFGLITQAFCAERLPPCGGKPRLLCLGYLRSLDLMAVFYWPKMTEKTETP